MITKNEQSISLENEINESEKTSKSIKEKTAKLLKDAKTIIKNNPNRKLKKDYEDIQTATIKALKVDNPIHAAKQDLYTLSDELSNGEITETEFEDIKKEYNDLYSKNDSFEFDRRFFLDEKDGEYVSKEKVNKTVEKNLIEDAKRFLNSNLSLEDLSVKQVGWMMSGICILGEPYTKQLKEKLNLDPKGLIYLEKNWGKGGEIDKRLQIPADQMKPLIKNLIESTSIAINIQVQTILFKFFPEKEKEEIFKLALDTTDKITEEVNKGNPNAIITILDKIIEDKEELFKYSIDILILYQFKNTLENNDDIQQEKETVIYEENTIFTQSTETMSQITNKSVKLSHAIESMEVVLQTADSIDTGKGVQLQDIYIQSAKKGNDTKQILADVKKEAIKLGVDASSLRSIDTIIIKIEKDEERLVNETEIKETEKSVGKNERKQIYNNEIRKIVEKDDGTFNIILNTGKEVQLDKNEKEIVENNLENLKNLLKFKETLSDLNLDFIWEHRIDFIKKINIIDPTLNVKIDNKNYINETELKKILNTIISLTGNEKNTGNNLDGIVENLRDISNSGLDENKKDNEGSPIEKIFIQKGIINKNSSLSYFNLEEIKNNYK